MDVYRETEHEKVNNKDVRLKEKKRPGEARLPGRCGVSGWARSRSTVSVYLNIHRRDLNLNPKTRSSTLPSRSPSPRVSLELVLAVSRTDCWTYGKRVHLPRTPAIGASPRTSAFFEPFDLSRIQLQCPSESWPAEYCIIPVDS